ncbi:MAG: heavy metal translocating P-type ATPase [Candidatus Heimdallarchaeaceae archaeon]
MRNMEKFQASVQGMDCADCVTKITKTLQNSKGVKNVTLNLVSTRLIVEYDEAQINPKEIAKKVKKLGYRLTSEYQIHSFFNLRHNPELLFTILGTIFLLTAILFEHFTGFQYYYIFYIATLLIGGYPILRKSIATLSAKRIDIEVLMVIAVTGASIIQEWTEAGVIVVLFSLAELLEKYSMDKTRKSIHALMDLTPPTAIKFQEGKKHIEIPVEELVVGDKISIKPGGRIPIDGKVEWGTSYVDQSPITGESTPILKTVGSQVIAGSINMDGYLVVRVTRMPSESTVSRIIQLVEEAEQVKSKIELFIQKFAKYYTPVMVFISFLVTFIPVVIFQQPFHFWFYNSLIILIIACPCALVLSTPITVVTAITRASKKGVLIKGGKYIEELSSIRSIAIDKTGTLSTGKLKAYKVEVFDSQSRNEILALACGLERYADHPIAKAIVAYGEKNNTKEIQFEDVKNLPGMGIMGRYKDKTYYLGNETLCNKISSQDNISCSEGESTIAYLFTDENILAHFHLSDELRPEAKEVVKQLKHLGYHDIWMLTGDNEEVASKIAEDLGIKYRAELLPEDKVTVVKKLKEKNHKIAMLGDGINDAPALATADVGIAMGSEGTAIAVETADIVLSTDNLFALPMLIRLSRKTKRTIQANIGIAVITKLIFFVLAMFGIATLWMTVLIADMGASLIVIFNAMLMGKAISRQS